MQPQHFCRLTTDHRKTTRRNAVSKKCQKNDCDNTHKPYPISYDTTLTVKTSKLMYENCDKTLKIDPCDKRSNFPYMLQQSSSLLLACHWFLGFVHIINKIRKNDYKTVYSLRRICAARQGE